MANITPRVRNYSYAAPVLQALEDDFMLGGRGIFPASTLHPKQLHISLDDWYMKHYGVELKALPGPEPRNRATIKLITYHVEKLTHDFGKTLFSPDDISADDRQEFVQQYEQKIRGWVSAVASLAPCSRNELTDRYVGKDVQDFYLANKGALVRVFGTHNLLVDFVAHTQGPPLAPDGRPDGSLLTPYVGSLLAIAMAQEFGQWEGERSPWEEEDFPCMTLRDVDQSVLDQRGVGETFAAECRQIRRGRHGIDGFGTAQWYIDHDLAQLVASLCDRSRKFDRGIDECNNKIAITYTRSEDDKAFPELGDCDGQLGTVQALLLLRKSSAAYAFSNAVFFAFGNAESRHERCCIAGIVDVIGVIEKVVADKALFGRLCEMERDFSSHHNAMERLRSHRTFEKEWDVGQRAAGHSVVKEGESITDVIDALFKNFPKSENRQTAIGLLCDLYEPCRGGMDPARHSEITELAVRELARGLTPPSAHPAFGHN